MSNKKVFITINVSPEHFQNMEIRGSCSNPAICNYSLEKSTHYFQAMAFRDMRALERL
jgi:hypothetical protein